MPKKRTQGFAVPKYKTWVMPAWMEHYREHLNDFGLGVEDLMNDHESKLDNNAYRAMVCVELKAQVRLLTSLHDHDMLLLGSNPSR